MQLRKTSLGRQTKLFLLLVFALMGILIILIFKLVMFRAIIKLEDSYVAEHVVRVDRSIQEKMNRLQQVAGDWGPWDDSYVFAGDHNQAYIRANLAKATFVNLDVDMMVFVDHAGKYAFAKMMDPQKERLVPVSTDLREKLKESGLLANNDPNVMKKGIVMLAEGPMLFASCPITKSDYTGAVRGNVIFGQLLDAKLIADLGKDLNLQLAAVRIDRKHDPKFNMISREEPIIIDSSADRLLAYSAIPDVFHQPAVGMIIKMNRDFSAAARKAAGWLVIGLLIVATVSIILIGFFMEKKILLRLKRLCKNVDEVGMENSSFSCLPDDRRDDEIAFVSQAINAMLHNLEASKMALANSEEKYRTFVEMGRDIVFAIAKDGAISYISPNCGEIMGCAHEEMAGKPFAEMIHPDSHAEWRIILQQVAEQCRHFDNYEFLGRACDETWRWYRMDGSLLNDFNKNIYIMGVFYDIHEKKIAEMALREAHTGMEVEVKRRTQQLLDVNNMLANEVELRKIAQEKFERLAYFDHLTGLPNRLLLMDRLHQAIDLAKRIEKPLGILYMDLDGFKSVNDTMGHNQGDELLKAVAARLSKLVRKSDTVARMSGDEFIIMIQNMGTSDQIQKIADEIIDAFRYPFELHQQEVYVTATVGGSVFPADGETEEALIKNADLAMYKAKTNGKNQRVFCTTIMKEIVEENMKLSNALYRALEKNELEVYYQPQVSYSTQRIVGLEALLRWNHPEMGMIPPVKFIPLAEQTGLINPIGEWVMRNVCKQNKMWQEAGLPHIRIAVNLSIIQFQNPQIISQIKDILQDSQLSSQYLELEITESIAMRDTEFIIKVLSEMQEIGVYISIDDFGTEFSSLNYLKVLPINRIKIPMPFIQGINVNEKDEAITKTIIALAKNMGMDVIAEGVETQQQESFLTQRMCDEMQGFYYYKPMPAKEIEALLIKEMNTVEKDYAG